MPFLCHVTHSHLEALRPSLATMGGKSAPTFLAKEMRHDDGPHDIAILIARLCLMAFDDQTGHDNSDGSDDAWWHVLCCLLSNVALVSLGRHRSEFLCKGRTRS